MTTRITDSLEAVDHLPAGARLIFPRVTWDEYERWLGDLSDRPGLRVTYDQGRLEITSPLPEHEAHARFIDRLVYLILRHSPELTHLCSPRLTHRQEN